jgi:hypothetical protein
LVTDVLHPKARHEPVRPTRTGSQQTTSIVYTLGLFGALVWYWRQASGARGHLIGVLKALVWPAFLVYEAFSALGSRAPVDRDG